MADYLISFSDIDMHLCFLDEPKFHEYLLVCDADYYGEAEDKALKYYWNLLKSDREFIYEACFDEFADSNFETDKLVELFGEEDGTFLQYIHKKYGRKALYECEIYFWETEDKGSLTPEDKLRFKSLSDSTCEKLYRKYASNIIEIVKVHGSISRYDKYIKLCDIATRI